MIKVNSLYKILCLFVCSREELEFFNYIYWIEKECGKFIMLLIEMFKEN